MNQSYRLGKMAISGGDYLGEFEIVREIGRGGMGVVYEARQPSLSRKVALKVIRGGLSVSATVIQRFRREAESAAKLTHPNIVPIYSTGAEDGRNFYAMELVEGPSLDDVVTALCEGSVSEPLKNESTETIPSPSPLDATIPLGTPTATDPPSRPSSSTAPVLPGWVFEILGARDSSEIATEYFDNVARLIAGVASGLEYAHDRKVIHRDIKPANLLLSRDGRLSINDFGLARTLEQPGITQSGEFVGSPLYMPPEQIGGRRAPLDHRVDIYSLGATLYQLLTLEPPVQGTTRDEVLTNVLHGETIPPRRHQPRIPVDLETICLKAMDRDPDRRYATAGEFARDLHRFVDREVISARRIGTLERGWRWIRRHRALSIASIIAVVSAIIGVSFFVQDRIERRKRARDAALVAAWNGDFASAESSIETAQKYGASRSWALMARGQVDLLQGKTRPAIVKLESVVGELSLHDSHPPRSVSAAALLANAHFQDGNWWAFRRSLEALGEPRFETADDRLFFGWALTWNDPEEAAEILEKAINERFHSPIPRVLYSIALSQRSLQEGNPRLARQALRAATTAKAFIEKDDSLADGAELFSLLALASTEPEKKDIHLESARGVVEGTKGTVGLPTRFHWLVHYFLASESYEEALAEYEKHARNGINVLGYFVWPYYAAAIGSGQFARAHEFLNALVDSKPEYPSRMDLDVELVRALLATALDTDAGRTEARDIYESLVRSLDTGALSIESCGIVLLIPCFLGDHAGAEATAKRFLEGVRREVRGAWMWPRVTVEFIAGEIPERNLLETTTLEKSRAQYGETRYWLGMIRLTRGDRAGARECFLQSAKSGVFNFHGPTVAPAILTRMEKHERWPEWLGR